MLLVGSSVNLLKAQVSSNVTFRGQLDYANDLNDIWGWRNPADGKEYALVGLTNGFSIVDVSNPASPVQLHFVSGANTIWRDVKTWGNYAYVVNEGSGGLLVVNMANLPGSITSSYLNLGIGYSTSHNIFIDENGIAYLCGSNGSLGTVMIDVDANPANPPVVGSYTTRYVHDLFVRGDTMWTAEINNGIFSVVDVSNKAAPVVLATQATSGDFTHNLWLTDDGRYLYTTDEISGGNVDGYDVSDLGDIQELDRFRPGTGTSSIPHNTFVRGNFLVTAWYRDGLRITDATQPDNLIEVGWYDTSPLSGNGFNGAWGVYPYLPSGNALISDIEGGLFVVTPSYTGAAFLEGVVTDQVSGVPLSNATVSISSSTASDLTNIFGQYATGLGTAGSYTVTVSRAGYVTQTLPGIVLNLGSTTVLNVALIPATAFTLTGSVRDAISSAGIPNAKLLLQTGTTAFSITADAAGNFSLAGFPSGVYDVYSGKWGYLNKLQSGLSINPGSGPLAITLQPGFQDDFVVDQGWTTVNTAASGLWTRGEPIGTDLSGVPSNPDLDLTADLGAACFVTGNGGGAAGTDDVDNGRTTLRSPFFDLSSATDPQLSYARWFFNSGGSGAPNDSLIVKLSNGTTTVVLETVTASTPGSSSWVSRTYRILDFLPLSASMRLTVETADAAATGHIVEGAFDGFAITDVAAPVCAPPTGTFANNITATSARVNWTAVPGALSYQVQGRKVGTTNFRNSTTSGTFRNVSGLNSGTAYEWKVRVQCSSGEISAFSPLSTFSTLALRTEPEPVASLSPNPASTQTLLSIESAPEGPLEWQLLDLLGRPVLAGRDRVEPGITQLPLNLVGLPAGVYLVAVSGTDWKQQIELLITESN
jgi:choice-of-anchor B domain-containing protein